MFWKNAKTNLFLETNLKENNKSIPSASSIPAVSASASSIPAASASSMPAASSFILKNNQNLVNTPNNDNWYPANVSYIAMTGTCIGQFAILVYKLSMILNYKQLIIVFQESMLIKAFLKSNAH